MKMTSFCKIDNKLIGGHNVLMQNCHQTETLASGPFMQNVVTSAQIRFIVACFFYRVCQERVQAHR